VEEKLGKRENVVHHGKTRKDTERKRRGEKGIELLIISFFFGN